MCQSEIHIDIDIDKGFKNSHIIDIKPSHHPQLGNPMPYPSLDYDEIVSEMEELFYL